jgi:WD40 repeat protein
VLVSNSRQGKVRVWDVETQQELVSLETARGYACSAAFSPDGRLLVVGGGDGTVWLWGVQ